MSSEAFNRGVEILKETTGWDWSAIGGGSAVYTIETSYDHEGCFARVLKGEHVIASEYAFCRENGGWEGARDTAIDKAKQKAANAIEFGPKPDEETFSWDGSLDEGADDDA